MEYSRERSQVSWSIFTRWYTAVEIYHLNSDEVDWLTLPSLSFRRSVFNSLMASNSWDHYLSSLCSVHDLQIMSSSRRKALKCIKTQRTERKLSTQWIVITSRYSRQYVTKTQEMAKWNYLILFLTVRDQNALWWSAFAAKRSASILSTLRIKLEEHSVYALRVTKSLKFFHGTKTMTDHLYDRVLIMFRNFVYFAGAFIETLILWLYSFKVDLQSFPSCKF